jgi:predicted SnoaL-like aldol condensation-catalyzing enzyme
MVGGETSRDRTEASSESTQALKRAAVEFLKLVVAGQIDEAYRTHVDIAGKHHNPFFPSGFQALQEAMKDDHTRFPRKRLEIKNVLGDGDRVAVHSELIQEPGGRAFAVVHLFRFHQERIVELWDCAQPVPENTPNGDGMF